MIGGGPAKCGNCGQTIIRSESATKGWMHRNRAIYCASPDSNLVADPDGWYVNFWRGIMESTEGA